MELPGFIAESAEPSAGIQALELKMRLLQWRKQENDAKIKNTITRVNQLQEELTLPRMALDESQVRARWTRDVVTDEARRPLQAGYSQIKEQEQRRAKHELEAHRLARIHMISSTGPKLAPNCKNRFHMKKTHRGMKKTYDRGNGKKVPTTGTHHASTKRKKIKAYRGQELLQRSIADLPSSIDHSRRPFHS